MSKIAENGPQFAVENFAWPLNEQTLGLKKQFEGVLLGKKPISVIKGNPAREYQSVYDAGVAAGNGTKEQRTRMLSMIYGLDEKYDAL